MANNSSDHKHATIPEFITPPAWVFSAEYVRLLGFIVYITNLATSTDERSRIAIRALYEDEDLQKELEKVDSHGAIHILRKKHRTLVFEMTLSRAAENFLAYVTELLVMVFKCRPEMLRSSETVRLDEILRHTSMAELIHELAERRVHQLS
jgi:hypothetical protein